MIDSRYKNSKIYKITDIGYNMCYIGSTIQPLSKRFSHHKGTYHTDACASSIIFKTYGRDNCKITLLKNYPCDNVEQLKAKEGEYIESMDCVNKFIADGNKALWDKRHYEKNKEKYSERNKLNYQKNKPKRLEQAKTWGDNNREYKRQKDKEYREKNKEILNPKKLEPILCECGCYSVRSSIARHRQSKKHIELMKLKET